jgi:hypothetical protein
VKCLGGNEMTIKSIILNLSPEETLRLTRILMDEDNGEAFLFLKECLKPQLEHATRDH